MAIILSAIVPMNNAHSQGISQLLLDKIPVPEPRPDFLVTGSIKVSAPTRAIVSGGSKNKASPIYGSLADGLSALGKNNTAKALSIRAGLSAGSLDRKILAWAIAVSGKDGVASGTIAAIAQDLPRWPGQSKMAENAERALASENLSPNSLITAFGTTKPKTVEGAIALADAHLMVGNRGAARAVLQPFWRTERLDKKQEQEILNRFGSILGREDHRHRMHQMFYDDRAKSANRVAALAEQYSLAKARTAALRTSPNTNALLAAVAPSSKKDVGYLFARIEHARRTKDFPLAVKLLLSAPTDPKVLVDPDEWWVERRIASRILIEKGDFKTAYRIASNHSAESPKSIIDAEFHSGWYALRFLNNPGLAQKHFAKLLQTATRPISKARGHYWMARASTGNVAKQHFRAASRYPGTYYGQLASHKLGIRALNISRPKPTDTDRKDYRSNELVRAIKRLEKIGQEGWSVGLYLHLARELDTSGQLAILSADAEKQRNYRLSLQIGKIANGRGFDVDTLAWPLGAIPGSAKISSENKALAYAISRQESAFDKRAVSKANARGMMQLLPGTAKAVARKAGYKYSFKRLTTDAAYNATLGTAYLSDQLDEFENSYVLTFAAYNAGPGRVREWLERFGDPRNKSLEHIVDWVEQIPYTETRSYVQRVLENYQVYKARIAGSRLSIAQDLKSGRR